MEQQYHFSEFDLSEIFRNVWGYTAPPYLFSLQNKIEDKLFPKTETSEDYAFGATYQEREFNIHGVPFYADNNNGNRMFLPIWLIKPDESRFLLQNTVSSMTCNKTIVETPLVNRQGTVKEEMSVDDWKINVKGIIVSADNDYPDAIVSALNDLFEMQTALGILNARTSLVLTKDEKVVINSLKFPEVKGMKRIQAFEMDLTSDIAFTLILE